MFHLIEYNFWQFFPEIEELLAFKCDFKIILIPLWCTNRVHHFLGFLAKKRFLFDAQVGGIMDHEKWDKFWYKRPLVLLFSSCGIVLSCFALLAMHPVQTEE